MYQQVISNSPPQILDEKSMNEIKIMADKFSEKNYASLMKLTKIEHNMTFEVKICIHIIF